jgi:hypothetical protein
MPETEAKAVRPIPTDDDAVLTAAQVESFTSLGRFTLIRMRQRPNCDGLPYVQLSSNRIGYVRRDVMAFLAARRKGSLPVTAQGGGLT